jgi:hypothetical protein
LRKKADLWDIEFIIYFRVDGGDEVEKFLHFVGLYFGVVVGPFDFWLVFFIEEVGGETDVAMTVGTLLVIY